MINKLIQPQHIRLDLLCALRDEKQTTLIMATLLVTTPTLLLATMVYPPLWLVCKLERYRQELT